MKAIRRLAVSLALVLAFAAVPAARADSYPMTMEEIYAYAGFDSPPAIRFAIGEAEVEAHWGPPAFSGDGYVAYYMEAFVRGAEEAAIFSYRFDSEGLLYMILIDFETTYPELDEFIAALCDSGFGEKVSPDSVAALHAVGADAYVLEFPSSAYGRYAYLVANYGEPFYSVNLILSADPSFKDSFYGSGYPSSRSALKATGNVNVREMPSLGSKSLGTLSKGATARYLGASAMDDRGIWWHKVSYKNGSGWISSVYGEFSVGGPDATQAPTQTGANEQSYTLVTDLSMKGVQRYATFDYVELHFYSPGTKNAKGEVMDHDGVDIVNNNPKLRTYELRSDCEIIMPIFYSTEYIDLSENQPVSFKYFSEHFNDVVYGDRPMIFHVTVEGGKVAKLELWYDYYIGG